MAKGRLESLLKRLKRTPELLSAYHKEIDQLRVQNFVEEADQNYEGLHTYLPHHPVIRQDKKSTKIRLVFDGAAKSKYGPSLNDVLETGPNLNPDLLAVLMRFRLNKIAWIADIEKAFLNIALHPEDAEAVRFLWITEPETPNSPLVAYKWKRVPFGLSSSPFLLRATLNKHLDGMESIYSTTVRQLKEQIYVDDYLGGADNISTAKTRIQETKSIFQEAKLNMRSWVTNDKTVRKFLSEKGLINPIWHLAGSEETPTGGNHSSGTKSMLLRNFLAQIGGGTVQASKILRISPRGERQPQRWYTPSYGGTDHHG
ncbi:uncharacterized protein LOC123476924 [Daphnia magna]|uniref:uncharacterized protein LOC123476924 n=1 Tax=Daphnia magna TaxID=35525 RepID=UPI001E1BA4F5|nr:uncharacterized protein LOC123476924 [Daphnia magna]